MCGTRQAVVALVCVTGVTQGWQTQLHAVSRPSTVSPWASAVRPPQAVQAQRSRRGQTAQQRMEMSSASQAVEAPTRFREGPMVYDKVALSSGVTMEVITQKPGSTPRDRERPRPPIIFIHGSYHAAWCWAEHWMPFLATLGYETHALSLRGTSGTPVPVDPATQKPSAKLIKLADHLADIGAYMDLNFPKQRPVMVAHSFGGLILMKYLESLERPAQRLAGAVWLCSVPPTGNGPMTGRFLKERFWDSMKIFIGFVFKLATRWPWLAQELFFTDRLEEKDLRRYMQRFQADSQVGLDLADVTANLPTPGSLREERRAGWLWSAPPRLVLGAELDFIVDEQGVAETAKFLGVHHHMLRTAPHDVMLGPDWTIGADRLVMWLEETDFTKNII